MKDHVPPLLRGVGFLMILIASLIVGAVEHRDKSEQRQLAMLTKARIAAIAAESEGNGRIEAISKEIRLLRLQLQQEDLADRVFENPWFQVVGAVGSLLVALSFLYEAHAKWPRKPKIRARAGTEGNKSA